MLVAEFPPTSTMAFFTQIAEVTGSLYLCGASAVTVDRLRHLGIDVVINCTIEVPHIEMMGVENIRIALEDSPHSQLGDYFDQCADKINQTKNKGGRTLVHCIAGVSRSASICIAYLMKHSRMSLREAYNHVKVRRMFIRPNVGFFKQLIEYEKRLFGGKSTIDIVASPIGAIPDVYEEQTKNMVWLRKPGTDK